MENIVIDKATLAYCKEKLQEEAFTIIHCTYVAKQKFINGGWINIYPTTYLEFFTNLFEERSRLNLIHSVNVPIAPKRFHFNKKGDVKKFILYFPAIPKHWKTFDLVEVSDNKDGFRVCQIHRNTLGVYEVFLD